MRGRALRARAALRCILLLAAGTQLLVAADQATERYALQQIGAYLSSSDPPLGWSTAGDANPCDPVQFPGVSCSSDGSVSSISLAGKPLVGSLPDDKGVWGGLPGLTSLDFGGTGLGGAVPAALASAGALSTVNLANNNLQGQVPPLSTVSSLDVSGNVGICGAIPEGMAGKVTPDPLPLCDGAAPPLPPPLPVDPPLVPPVPSPDASASPSPFISPSPSPDGSPLPSPEPSQSPEQSPSPEPSPEPSPSPSATLPSPSPAPIAASAICACAMKGFADGGCQAAFSAACANSGDKAPPAEACNAYSSANSEAGAAQSVATYLQNECFAGQGSSDNACACAANTQTTDCAKGWLSVCARGDAACLAFQNYNDPASAATLATYFDQNCPVPSVDSEGVLVGMLFADTTIGTYLSQNYNQGVANALSSVADVPSSDVTTLDVRPVANARRRARALLQSGSTGVSATYFVASSDPEATLSTLQTAANDGSLTEALNANGISGTPTATLQAVTEAPPPESSSSFPTWAIVVICIVGALIIAGLIGFLLLRARRKKRAAAYADPAPSHKRSTAEAAPTASEAATASRSADGDPYNSLPVSKSVRASPAAVNADGSGYPPLPPSGNTHAAAAGAAAVVGTAAGAAAVAARRDPEPEPVAPAGASLTPWEDAPPAAAVAAPLAPVRTKSIPREPPATGAPPATRGLSSLTSIAPSRSAAGAAPGDGGDGGGGAPLAAAAAPAAAAAAAAPGLASEGSTSSMAPRNSFQQQERAKFWAQFQETWQQVRQTKKVDDPATPSSGTQWSETDAGASPTKR